MNEVEALKRARQIAEAAHAGQTDKLGRPFIEHLERVAMRVEGNRSRTVAYLHDLLEKSCGWTAQDLVNEGFAPDIVAAVQAMTRQSGEDYLCFARRALSDGNARPVKVADLIDNRQQAWACGKDPSKYVAALNLIAGVPVTTKRPREHVPRQPDSR